MQLAQLCTVAATPVAPGVHRRREEVGAGEAADEDRDEQTPETTGAFKGAALAKGGERDAARLIEAMRALCEAQPLVEVQYVAVVDARTLEPLTELGGRPARALIAASIGGTHLIDNIAL